ncbi:MAG TPA: hypothetical protein VFI86_04750, partial [Burkholderiales bacterium]|nr:hypothetical protein [Burkholderiales bacterium]
MRKRLSSWRIACGALLALAAGAAAIGLSAAGSAGGPFVVEHFRVPVRGYSLAVTVVRPRGKGPYGVIVLNHGVGATLEERRRES